MAATHREDPIGFRWFVPVGARRRREARERRRLREVDGFLGDLHADLGDRRSLLARTVARYRRTLRAP